MTEATADDIAADHGPVLASFLADLTGFISKRLTDDDLVGAGNVMARILAPEGWSLEEFAIACATWAAQQPDGRQVNALPHVRTIRDLMRRRRHKHQEEAGGTGPTPVARRPRRAFMEARRAVDLQVRGITAPSRDLSAAPPAALVKHSARKGPLGTHECGPGCPSYDARARRDARREEILLDLPDPLPTTRPCRCDDGWVVESTDPYIVARCGRCSP